MDMYVDPAEMPAHVGHCLGRKRSEMGAWVKWGYQAESKQRGWRKPSVAVQALTPTLDASPPPIHSACSDSLVFVP